MIEKGIAGGICHAIYSYATAHKKYMKQYNWDHELSYIIYCDANNLCRWTMS